MASTACPRHSRRRAAVARLSWGLRLTLRPLDPSVSTVSPPSVPSLTFSGGPAKSIFMFSLSWLCAGFGQAPTLHPPFRPYPIVEYGLRVIVRAGDNAASISSLIEHASRPATLRPLPFGPYYSSDPPFRCLDPSLVTTLYTSKGYLSHLLSPIPPRREHPCPCS